MVFVQDPFNHGLNAFRRDVVHEHEYAVIIECLAGIIVDLFFFGSHRGLVIGYRCLLTTYIITDFPGTTTTYAA